jgi:hypothetical protein
VGSNWNIIQLYSQYSQVKLQGLGKDSKLLNAIIALKQAEEQETS